MSSNNVVIDASGAILGRLSTYIAKRLLAGETIDLINVEKIVISGDPQAIISEYKQSYTIRSIYNPLRGPFHRKRPDFFVRKTIRGMLPHKKPRGMAAFHRLKCYIAIPKDFEKIKPIRIPEADASKLKVKSISVGELCQRLGWHYDPNLDPANKVPQ